MIVKNEEALLKASIVSAVNILKFDEIIVVDTGSTDKTKDIAVDSGARVFDFVWINDFAAARNFATEKAKNDWIFLLDADEEITEADLISIRKFIENTSNVGVVTRVELSNMEATPNSRLYNRNFYEMKGTIHEQITPIGVHSKVLTDIPITMIHHGYIPEISKAKGTHERNSRMLKEALEKQPNDPYLLYKLGNAYYYRDMHEACKYLEQALSLITDFSLLYVYKAVELYGYALINTEQYEKALDVRNKYAKYYENKPQFRFLQAHIYQNNGKFQEAVQSYESCIGADVADFSGITSYLSYYNIGVILECVGMIEEAIDIYIKCGDYEPAQQRLAELAS